jgi:hypothetical protein
MTRVCVALFLMFNVIALGRARAQEMFQVNPLFSTAQEYDSNLFYTSFNRQADFVTRVSPGIESAYRSPVLTMLGRYSFDVERFARHPELTAMDARQRAGTSVTYRPTQRLAVAADAELLKTRTPGELNALTNITLGRARAERVSAHSSITRQLDMVTSGTIDYMFTGDHIAGGPAMRSHAATLGVDRHRSSRETISVAYRFHQFMFDTSTATSHTLSLAWTRAITRRASVSLGGGPRVTNGSPAADLSASLRHQFKSGAVSLGYARTQTTIVGLTGVTDTQSLSATAEWNVRPSLQMRLSPTVFRSAQPSVHADVYQLTGTVARRIAQTLSLEVALNAYLQRGNLYTGRATETIPRQNVLVRLVAAPAARPR